MLLVFEWKWYVYLLNLQFCSNPWLLNLIELVGYEKTQESLLSHCEAYHIDDEHKFSKRFFQLPKSKSRIYTKCPYIKTHEPWFSDGDWKYYNLADRAALVLRHPYDSALSEFKRYTKHRGKVCFREAKQYTNIHTRFDRPLYTWVCRWYCSLYMTAGCFLFVVVHELPKLTITLQLQPSMNWVWSASANLKLTALVLPFLHSYTYLYV